MEHLEGGLGQKIGTHGITEAVIRAKMSTGAEWRRARGEAKASVL